MNKTIKIRQIWQYLEVQDDEVLIIPFYNESVKKNEFLIAEQKFNKFKVTVARDLPLLNNGRSFRIVQQRDSKGSFVIPSVKELLEEKFSDY